jgi:hypothetical protein
MIKILIILFFSIPVIMVAIATLGIITSVIRHLIDLIKEL